MASLANLCLSDVEEAKKLVPTLGDSRFEDEEEAWKAAQKAVADGYVAKRPTARDAAAKAAGLPRSKHVGVTWHKVDKKNSNHC